MNIETRFEIVKRFFNNVKNPARNCVENAVNALFGNPVAFEKCLEAVINSPFFIREQMFWTKLSMFLDGINLSDEDRAKFRAKLSENGTAQENAERLITLIDRTDTKKKIRYFINATRCLLADFITSSEYFRDSSNQKPEKVWNLNIFSQVRVLFFGYIYLKILYLKSKYFFVFLQNE